MFYFWASESGPEVREKGGGAYVEVFDEAFAVCLEIGIVLARKLGFFIGYSVSRVHEMLPSGLLRRCGFDEGQKVGRRTCNLFGRKACCRR